MLGEMLNSSLVTMNLRIVDHAAILAPQAELCARVMTRDREICHVCGFSVPGYMELDHLKGHRKAAESELACICPFCHALKHPLWAGARKRIVPIYAPDLSQEDLNRMAWVALAWRGQNRPDKDPVAPGIETIVSDMKARQNQLTKLIGCTSAEALFEAVLGLQDLIDRKEAIAAAMRLDQFIRFWPSELTKEHAELDRGSRLSTWDIGGYRVVAEGAATAIRGRYNPDTDKLQAAAAALADN
ncbi:hypothetical protein [Paracoccus sp. ME4]|uniref:hypothetical protein n=1 Tax=Paracoccus sp. ME4 TaxID=3138066 RepID=UPI00398B79F1